jgi:hypothetical protein
MKSSVNRVGKYEGHASANARSIPRSDRTAESSKGHNAKCMDSEKKDFAKNPHEHNIFDSNAHHHQTS